MPESAENIKNIAEIHMKWVRGREGCGKGVGLYGRYR